MRHRIMRVLPWLVTVGIFAFIFQRVPVADVGGALRQVPVWVYLALMIPYSLVYCGIDAFVLYRVMNWFHARVTYLRILPVRAAAYILSLLNPGLGQGGVAFALHRREGVPLLEIAGSLVFLTVVEFCQLALYAALGIFAFHPHLRAAFAPVYAVLAIGVGGVVLGVHKGIDPLALARTVLGRWRRGDPAYRATAQLQHLSLLRTLRRARLGHYLLTLLYKAPNFLLAVVVHYLALQLFGVHVPFVRLLTFLPIVFLVASLPVTVAHLGTTQAAWLYFFSPYGEASHLLAYSLVAHVTFMTLNGLIGVCFLRLALQGRAA
jgi:uncharacterized membrane protein YbhN (UPF0104 family)